jgi:hypothetical protein
MIKMYMVDNTCFLLLLILLILIILIFFKYISSKKEYMYFLKPTMALNNIKITLQVVVDDLLEAPWDDRGVTIMPTSVPTSAQQYIREYIQNNEFDFHTMLTKIPLRGLNRKSTYTKYIPTEMKGVAILSEGKDGEGQDVWFVKTVWQFDAHRSSVDDTKLLADLFAQMSDGWGEGASQLRFGHCVANGGRGETYKLDTPLREYKDSDVNYDVMGRFAFNLTAIGARIL